MPRCFYKHRKRWSRGPIDTIRRRPGPSGPNSVQKTRLEPSIRSSSVVVETKTQRTERQGSYLVTMSMFHP